MAEEINELLEEGIALAGQLTDIADEAMDAIDEMNERTDPRRHPWFRS